MNMIKTIARKSRLSLLQVKEVFKMYPQIEYELKTTDSFGDIHKDISLLEGEAPEDIFTRELDEALKLGKVDIAIHSAKDLPYPLHEGQEVIALLPAFDTTDSLVSRNQLKLAELPHGSRIGTSSPLRKKELTALRPDLKICGVRGCIEERIKLVEEGELDAVIVATCALKRLGMTEYISEILPFKTHPLQGFLAITAQRGREDLKSLFFEHDILHKQGEVTIVGFGPGNPDLLTVAGVKALKEADIIYYDDLIDKQYLNQFSSEKVYVGKRNGKHSFNQLTLQELLLEAARAGKTVVRLKGGDPSIFAHLGEEVEYLESNLIRVNVIPGITTASALSACSKISLTHRFLSSSVAFVSGHNIDIPTPDADTLVYYMGAGNLKKIAQKLITKGLSSKTPVLLMYNVSMPDQQSYYTTLEELTNSDKVYPTPLVALIGAVIEQHFHKIQSQPHYVLLTGLSDNKEYEKYGTVIHTPLIEIKPISDSKVIRESIRNIESYNYLLFTSRYAVRYWIEALIDQGKDVRSLHSCKIVAIGHVTSSELKSNGIHADYVASEENSFGVVQLFSSLPKGRILLPRSDKALDIIPSILRESGYTIDTIEAYSNTFPEEVNKVDLRQIETIVFTSPSCVDGFLRLYGTFPENKRFITRGKITRTYLDKKIKDLSENLHCDIR